MTIEFDLFGVSNPSPSIVDIPRSSCKTLFYFRPLTLKHWRLELNVLYLDLDRSIITEEKEQLKVLGKVNLYFVVSIWASSITYCCLIIFCVTQRTYTTTLIENISKGKNFFFKKKCTCVRKLPPILILLTGKPDYAIFGRT